MIGQYQGILRMATPDTGGSAEALFTGNAQQYALLLSIDISADTGGAAVSMTVEDDSASEYNLLNLESIASNETFRREWRHGILLPPSHNVNIQVPTLGNTTTSFVMRGAWIPEFT